MGFEEKVCSALWTCLIVQRTLVCPLLSLHLSRLENSHCGACPDGKKPFITPLFGPFPVLLRLSWNAEAITTETTVASILKSLSQGQGPHLCIQTDGQGACGLPKVTQSVNNRAQQRRIPIAVIPPHTQLPACRTPMGTYIRQEAFSSRRRGKVTSKQ